MVIAGATYYVDTTMYVSPAGAVTHVTAASTMAFSGGEVLDLAVPTSRVTFVVRDTSGLPRGASIATTTSTETSTQQFHETDLAGGSTSGPTGYAGEAVTHISTGAHLTGSTLQLASGLKRP